MRVSVLLQCSLLMFIQYSTALTGSVYPFVCHQILGQNQRRHALQMHVAFARAN